MRFNTIKKVMEVMGIIVLKSIFDYSTYSSSSTALNKDREWPLKIKAEWENNQKKLYFFRKVRSKSIYSYTFMIVWTIQLIYKITRHFKQCKVYNSKK